MEWKMIMPGVWQLVPDKEPTPNPDWEQTEMAKRLREGLEALKRESEQEAAQETTGR